MDARAFDPKRFSGIVPIFPLPNVVLFPGMFLPLHIFEPRYRIMTAETLKGERLIAMALLKPGWQENYEGSPAVRPIVGVGKIVEDAKLEDGRYNLVLFGLIRARIVREMGAGPYRTATVELLADPEPSGKEADRQRRVLLPIYAQVMKHLMKSGVPQPPDDIPLGMLCDMVISLLVRDPAARQELLEELDPAARCDRLLKLIEGAGSEPAEPSAPRPSWPMGPSLN